MIPTREFEAHFIGSAHYAEFSPDGQKLAVVNSSKEVVIIYDVKSWRIILDIHELSIAFAFLDVEGESFAIGNMQGVIKIWEGGSFTKIKQLHSYRVDKIKLLGEKLVSMCRLRREVRLWNLRDDTVRHFEQKFCNLPYAGCNLTKQVLIDDAETINLYDVITDTITHTIDITNLKVLKSAISPNGEYIACLCDDQTIRLFEPNGKKVAEIKHRGEDASIIGFDSSSQHLIFAFDDGRHVHFWNIKAQNEAYKIPYQFDNIRSWAINTEQKIAIVSTHHFLTHSIVEVWSLT
jgi:WD40 repeat protein